MGGTTEAEKNLVCLEMKRSKCREGVGGQYEVSSW